jgi:hypothetical protein
MIFGKILAGNPLLREERAGMGQPANTEADSLRE